MSNSDPYTRDDQTRFTMRINQNFIYQIKSQAVRNKRSAAKEIEFIIEQYFENISKE